MDQGTIGADGESGTPLFSDFKDGSKMKTLEEELIWEKEVRDIAEQVSQKDCLNRNEKIADLVILIRKGSAHCEHGKVTDLDRLSKTLSEVEEICSKYYKPKHAYDKNDPIHKIIELRKIT